jgi:GrpB-like predicted nucleotidyltransferase (UPF0157 family)
VKLTSVIRDYDPSWPVMFADEARGLQPVFGDALVAVHHVGSTSVPGLLAKPEIDILIVVTSFDALGAWVQLLGERGYRRGGDLSVGNCFFKRDVDGVRTHKLHVCIEGHAAISQKLLFRDHLRGNAEDRARYGALKLSLEADNHGGIAEYLAGKAPFIEATMARLAKQNSG